MLGALFGLYLIKVNSPLKVGSSLRIAYEITLHEAEQIEILKHKWFESEKAGHDIGMENAEKSWQHFHADKWRASKEKAA